VVDLAELTFDTSTAPSAPGSNRCTYPSRCRSGDSVRGASERSFRAAQKSPIVKRCSCSWSAGGVVTEYELSLSLSPVGPTSMASCRQQTARDEFQHFAEVDHHSSVLVLHISPDIVPAQDLKGGNGLGKKNSGDTVICSSATWSESRRTLMTMHLHPSSSLCPLAIYRVEHHLSKVPLADDAVMGLHRVPQVVLGHL